MPHLMILDGCTCGKRRIAGSDTRIVRIIVGSEFGDTALVPGEVITQAPTEVRCLNGNGIHIKLDALILHPSDIGQNDVREIGSCRSADIIQQVLGTLVVILQSTRNAIVQYTEVDAEIISARLLPFQVRTVTIRLQQIGT